MGLPRELLASGVMRQLSLILLPLWLLAVVSHSDETEKASKEQWKPPGSPNFGIHSGDLNSVRTKRFHTNQAANDNILDSTGSKNPKDSKTVLMNIHAEIARSIKPPSVKNGTSATPSSSPTSREEYTFNTANPQLIKDHEHNLYSEKTVLDAYYHGLNRVTSKVYTKECYKVRLPLSLSSSLYTFITITTITILS